MTATKSSMLSAHFDAVEESILALSRIAENTGHSLHRGTPREFFVREFIDNHISKRISVGTGEIISSISAAGEPRNQFDIILYRNDYPKISIGGGIDCFLCESVVATIEVKSTLTEDELEKAIVSASKAKKLNREVLNAAEAGYIPPGILSYVVAYAGPAKVATIRSWIRKIEKAHGLNATPMPPMHSQRIKRLSESVEGIFVLGSGMLLYDNGAVTLAGDEDRANVPNARWISAQQNRGNLMWLFTLISSAVQGFLASWMDWEPYLSDYQPELNLD